MLKPNTYLHKITKELRTLLPSNYSVECCKFSKTRTIINKTIKGIATEFAILVYDLQKNVINADICGVQRSYTVDANFNAQNIAADIKYCIVHNFS